MIEKLKGHIPNNVLLELNSIDSKLLNPIQLSHFLGQCYHESRNFTVVEENLNYSADGLLKIFPKYFNIESAKDYSHCPGKIANRIYANRMGNGTEELGDGWDFRGRGYIQLTGKNNYAEFGKYVNENTVLYPDLVSEIYPLKSAEWFWLANRIDNIAIDGITDEIISRVTKRINGGLTGITDRIEKTHFFYSFLKEEVIA